MSKKQELQKFLEKALENIEVDRAKADFLLEDIIGILKTDKYLYKDLGPVSAKYLESLTRCNEQLVRIASLLKPKNTEEEDKITKQDKEDFFDKLLEKKE